MTDLTLVVNPASGHGRGRRLLPQIVALLKAAGITIRAEIAHSWEDARDLCDQAVASGVRGLIVVGGDGMAHLGHNACAGSSTTLGIIPAGTGNDFARAIGVPRRWREAVDIVAQGRTRVIDLMEVTGDLVAGDRGYVGSVISTGFDERVAERAERLPVDLGAPTYAFAVLAELRRFRPLTYELEIDGVSRTLPAMLVAVANAGIFGGGIQIAPDFDLTDGLMDITIVHPVPRTTLLALFPRLFSGSFVSYPAIERLQARELTIAWEGGFASADGEPLGRAPLTCRSVPGALTIFVPAQ